jgi:hypothetical protein
MASQFFTSLQGIWFSLLAMTLGLILYVSVLLIAGAIPGYSFEWVRHSYLRRHPNSNE